jgi:hypothetical protein
MMRVSLGPALVVAGSILVLIGLLAWGGLLSWFGRLPGDIRIVRPGARIYVPITSMVLVSIVLSFVLAVVRRLK